MSPRVVGCRRWFLNVNPGWVGGGEPGVAGVNAPSAERVSARRPYFVRRIVGPATRRTFLGLSPHNVRRITAERTRRTKSGRPAARRRPSSFPTQPQFADPARPLRVRPRGDRLSSVAWLCAVDAADVCTP
jgi:hypothetical protein